MKRYFFAVAVICVLLAGCGAHDAPSAEPGEARIYVEKTPSPEELERFFDVHDVEMIDTDNSTCFREVGYSDYYSKLVVRFRENDCIVYVYSDVPGAVWEEFISSSSLGSYYNKEIKGKYESDKVILELPQAA